MTRITITVNQDLYLRIERCAKHENKRSAADLARHAIAWYLDNHPKSTLFPGQLR